MICASADKQDTINHSKMRKFWTEMHQHAFGGRAPTADPLGKLERSPFALPWGKPLCDPL